MRVSPIIAQFNRKTNNITKTQTKFERNEIQSPYLSNSTGQHRYTGDASVDLAYASLKDKSIADALRLMELI